MGSPELVTKDFNLIKSFPNESIILPKFSRFEENYSWISKLDPDNELLETKREMIESLKKENPKQLPYYGFMFEEKKYNPFLRLRDPYYQELLDSQDEKYILLKLKGFEKMMKEEENSVVS